MLCGTHHRRDLGRGQESRLCMEGSWVTGGAGTLNSDFSLKSTDQPAIAALLSLILKHMRVREM